MLTIEPLKEEDISEIASAFAEIGWRKPAEQYVGYLRQQESGTRLVMVARLDRAFAGYGTLEWQSDYSPFRDAGIPEITDLNVLPQLQRQGIGSSLLAELERIAARRSPTAGIGVGLTPDYGAAQRLYILRGYVPDGKGAQAQGRPLRPAESVLADDSLVLYLTKSLA